MSCGPWTLRVGEKEGTIRRGYSVLPIEPPDQAPVSHSVKWDFRQATRWSVSRVFGQAAGCFYLTRRGCGQTCAYYCAADMYLGVRAFQLWETFSPLLPTHRRPL